MHRLAPAVRPLQQATLYSPLSPTWTSIVIKRGELTAISRNALKNHPHHTRELAQAVLVLSFSTII